MLKKLLLISFVMIGGLLLMAGCGASPTEMAPVSVVASPSPQEVYPAPEEAGAYPAVPIPYNPYPEPLEGQPTLTASPTSIPPTVNPSFAVVKGTLWLLDQPVAGTLLYLAEVITGETGGQAVAFSRTDSIRSETDEQGNFIFVNVPPGEYGLVLDRIIDSYLLLTPEEGRRMLIPIKANEQVDLGVLNYDTLPINPE